MRINFSGSSHFVFGLNVPSEFEITFQNCNLQNALLLWKAHKRVYLEPVFALSIWGYSRNIMVQHGNTKF